MKFFFKRTGIIISIIMGGVFLYQIYWIRGLYQNMGNQLDHRISEAMGIADEEELFLRIDSLSADTARGGELNVSAGYDDQKNLFYARQDSNDIIITQETDSGAGYDSYKENAKTIERLANYFQKGMHQAIDSIMPADLKIYDSLLSAGLKSRGIPYMYILQKVNLDTDSVFESFHEDQVPGAHLKNYDYTFDLHEKYAYRIYISNPNRLALRQMIGILFTSVLIFVLLIYIFIYLLGIIRKLQTEEELKTNFTNNMTHELKTPIAVSYAAVDALLITDQVNNRERQIKYLNIAKEQMDRLTGLVEQILSMSRKGNKKIELKRQKILLKDLLTNITGQLKLINDSNIHCEMCIDPENLEVVADRLHLYNILNNLIENGIKYSYGQVSVKIRARKEGEGVCIEIEDKGIGIDPKYQSRIFDRFYRVPTGDRHNVKGYGLGLFYVKSMTEQHGGTVQVKSQPGKGSVFTIKIPQ